MIRSGLLARYRDAGVSGVTANPTIFARALESSDAYADEIARRLEARQEPESIVWDLLIEDVQAAADVFRPVYGREHGGDGFVSIEVSPEIAGDTERTIAAARELQRRCARPNVMVKIPATPAGLPPIQTMIAEGANINVTLIFGIERYVKAVEAFLAGLEQHRARGGDVGRVNSVASFFGSPGDTKDHGQVELTLQKDVDGARHVLERLAMVGIDLAAITQELEDEGVSGFAKSFRESIEHLGKVRIPR